MSVTALYIGLPLVAYRRRDIIFATVQLVLCFIIVLISYCQRAFEANEKNSSNMSLVPSSTGRRSQQLQNYWVDGSIYRPNAQKIHGDYHVAGTMAQRADNEAVHQGVTKQQKPPNSTSRPAHSKSDSYGRCCPGAKRQIWAERIR
ncbi:hypothetical protein COOONC_17250 [Cooperia oncophora]